LQATEESAGTFSFAAAYLFMLMQSLQLCRGELLFLPTRSPVGLLRIVLFAAILFYGRALSFAQNSGVNLALHANSHASAADIGLPAYPGATLYKDADNDSAANLGLTLGDFHFTLIAINYMTHDSSAQVLAFYRKALSMYGEVLECEHDKPIGTPTVTRSGLTCSDEHGGRVEVDGTTNSSTDHELRAGSPHRYRIVGINKSRPGSTHFGLVYLELPKDDKEKSK
jgi:hypothetical protein